jgi:hypothetical protein
MTDFTGGDMRADQGLRQYNHCPFAEINIFQMNGGVTVTVNRNEFWKISTRSMPLRHFIRIQRDGIF